MKKILLLLFLLPIFGFGQIHKPTSNNDMSIILQNLLGDSIISEDKSLINKRNATKLADNVFHNISNNQFQMINSTTNS